MHYSIRLCTVVMFHVQRFEPHTYTVTEGFGALQMHLLLLINIVFKSFNSFSRTP